MPDPENMFNEHINSYIAGSKLIFLLITIKL